LSEQHKEEVGQFEMPIRLQSSFRNDPELQRLLEIFREDELVQAVHRARPNIRDCDIFLLSPVAIAEPIDFIFDEPPIGPRGIPWQHWLRITNMFFKSNLSELI